MICQNISSMDDPGRRQWHERANDAHKNPPTLFPDPMLYSSPLQRCWLLLFLLPPAPWRSLLLRSTRPTLRKGSKGIYSDLAGSCNPHLPGIHWCSPKHIYFLRYAHQHPLLWPVYCMARSPLSPLWLFCPLPFTVGEPQNQVYVCFSHYTVSPQDHLCLWLSLLDMDLSRGVSCQMPAHLSPDTGHLCLHVYQSPVEGSTAFMCTGWPSPF